jgi:hypothetical protein
LHGRKTLAVRDFRFELTDGEARMTNAQEHPADPARNTMTSTSGALALDLLGLRLNGAQLGGMLGVSRQAVSAAVKRGTISQPGPDGLFDARRAVREWMANSDPARVRARALKPGAEALAELRERTASMAADIARLHRELAVEREWSEQREQAASFRAQDDASQRLCRFTDALQERWAEAGGAATAGRLARWLDELAAVAYYGGGLDDFRQNFPESGDEADAEGDA